MGVTTITVRSLMVSINDGMDVLLKLIVRFIGHLENDSSVDEMIGKH